MTGPCRAATGVPSARRASTSTPWPDPLDAGRPDEHAGERTTGQPGRCQRGPRTTRAGGRGRCGARSGRWRRSRRWSGRPSSTSVASRIMPGAGAEDGQPVARRPASGSNKPGGVQQLGTWSWTPRRGGPGRRPPPGRGAGGPRRRRRRGRRAPQRGAGTRPAGRGPRPFTWGPRRSMTDCLPAPLGQLQVERADLVAPHGSPRPRETLAMMAASGSGWWPRRWPWPGASGRPT